MREALILGAGQIGTAIASRLLADGWRVRVATRGQRPLPALLAGRVDHVVADRTQAGGVARAVGGGADAVIDTIAYDARDADQLLGCRGAVGAFVVISSASVYADAEGRSLDGSQGRGFPAMPVPITEEQPAVEPGADTYARRKRSMELRMLDAGVPVAVIRPCAVHGPQARDPREWWFVKRLLDGRPRIPLAYRSESRFQTSGTANIAALVAAALATPATCILNACDPDAPTIAAIGHAVMAASGRSAELVAMTAAAGTVGMTPWSVPRPFVLDDAAGRAIGYAPVADYATGTVPACRWLLDNVPREGWASVLTGLSKYPDDLFDYAAEDVWLTG